MFFDDQIDVCGDVAQPSQSLEDGVLSLTFDDGPGAGGAPDRAGPRTLDLARMLHSLGIRATFFCQGSKIREFPDVAGQVSRLGHLVANHTFHHPNLADLLNPSHPNYNPQRLISEVIDTDGQLRAVSASRAFLFRAPTEPGLARRPAAAAITIPARRPTF